MKRAYSRIAILAFAMMSLAPHAALAAEEPCITVHADHSIGNVSRLLTGACIEDVNHEVYGGIYSQMVFGENFQEPPPQPTIKGFHAYDGLWSVRDRVLKVVGLDGPKLVSDAPPFRDGAVGVEMLFAERQGQNAGLIVRVGRPGAGADNFSGYEVSLDAQRQQLRLGRHRHDFQLIQDVPCQVAVGRWIPVEVRLSGAAIEILVDGKSALRHSDGPRALPAGAIGLRAWHRTAEFRNLWVQTGESVRKLPFEETAAEPPVSRMWRTVKRGTAAGSFALVTEQPFDGTQSQQVTFTAGEGQWGIENQGLNRWGMNFIADRIYEGYVWARSEQPAPLYVALESRDGMQVYAETRLEVKDRAWQRLDFTLTPRITAENAVRGSAGRLALKLKQPGSVTLGHAFLQPGDWGRFRGLPVRRDVAEGLVAQGITVLRYGGSMVNCPGYRWKKMTGPRDRRPSYQGTWYPHSSNGWGIVDFMDFCEAAGFEYIPDFHMGESPQDMADFIEYAKGDVTTPWGRRRADAGHPAPYRLRYMELGNEERVDEAYAARFESLARAIWAKDPQMILVVGDFAYNARIADPSHIQHSASGITNLAGQRRILQLARQLDREVWFDVHVGTDGPLPDASLAGALSFADALAGIADGAWHKVVVFELNAGNHSQRRALANVIALHAIERDGRMPIVTSANCLQPDGQNDNGWDQGLLFLDPARVWLQPPGLAAQMLARSYQPQLVQCDVTGAGNRLDAVAKRDAAGSTLVLEVVNAGDTEVTTAIRLAGFEPRRITAQVRELAGPLGALNTATAPETITTHAKSWLHGIGSGVTRYTFSPHSITTIGLE